MIPEVPLNQDALNQDSLSTKLNILMLSLILTYQAAREDDDELDDLEDPGNEKNQNAARNSTLER